jgi:uncharacterized protein (DUF2384 family)
MLISLTLGKCMKDHPMNSDINAECVPASMVRVVATRYGLSLKVLGKLIGIGTSAVYRKQGTLDSNISTHLLQLDRLMKIAIEYFGCEPNARAWFFQYNRGLVSEPIKLCGNWHGINRVENSLMKLMHGMTA